MKKNSILHPLPLVLTITTVITVNLISTLYFETVLFLGILFLLFIYTLKHSYYYRLVLIISTLLFVELNSGFSPLILLLWAFLSYLFVTSTVEKTFSFSPLHNVIHIIWFYFGVLLTGLFTNDINSTFITILLYNIAIDIVLMSLLL